MQARTAFEGQTTVGTMKRTADRSRGVLVPQTTRSRPGCVLLTGTGVVPPDEFTLAPGDHVAITIDGIGTLDNTVRVVTTDDPGRL